MTSLRRLLAAALLCAGLPAHSAEPDRHGTRVARVLAGLGADRADVHACLGEQIATEPNRRAEVERLTDVLDWIERAVTVPRRSNDVAAPTKANAVSDEFQEIVARFIHERRLDSAELASLTGGALVPRHVSTWARVQRALAAGHDPRRVLCGL